MNFFLKYLIFSFMSKIIRNLIYNNTFCDSKQKVDFGI